MAVLLPLPFLLPLLWQAPGDRHEQEMEGQRVTLLHPRLEELQAAYETRRPRLQLAGWIHKTLLFLLWAGLVVAMMRPEWLTPHTEVSTPGSDLMLGLDASHSMDALDSTVERRQVTRMAVVKGVMGRFVDSREGDRTGLIIFGSQSYILSPLTVDRVAVRQLLDGVVAGIAGQGTALGDAIALAAKKLRERSARVAGHDPARRRGQHLRRLRPSGGDAPGPRHGGANVTIERALAVPELAGLGNELAAALAEVGRATQAAWATGNPEEALANAVPYLQAFGHSVIAWIWLDVALCAQARLGQGSADEEAALRGKLAACRFFYRQDLPKVAAWLQVVASRDDTCRTMDESWF